MYCYNGAYSLNTNISKSVCVEVVSVLLKTLFPTVFSALGSAVCQGEGIFLTWHMQTPKGVVQMFSLSVAGNQRKLTLRKTS